MLSLKRAQEIKRIFLNEIEASRTIPGYIVQPFYDFYNQEFRPGKFAQMPCTCSPKIWIDMVKEVTDEVNQVLSSAQEEESKAVMEEPKAEPVKKKKGAAVSK